MNSWTGLQALQQDKVIIIAPHSSWLMGMYQGKKEINQIFGENIFIMGEGKDWIASNYYKNDFNLLMEVYILTLSFKILDVVKIVPLIGYKCEKSTNTNM